jgi:microcystin-dependent protein
MTVIASTLDEATEQGHSLWASMAFQAISALASRDGIIDGFVLSKPAAMTWSIGVGRGLIQRAGSADAGMVPFSVTAAETGTFTPGDAVKNRIDLIVARIVGSDVVIECITGALPSSGSPLIPAVPDGAIPLWVVPIPAGTSAGTGGFTLASAVDYRDVLQPGTWAGDIKYSAWSFYDPPGWLVADGREISRARYPVLFAAIGGYYGPGDGSTTFKLPDLRGRVTVGQSSGDPTFDTLGELVGEKTHTLTTAELAAHSHNEVLVDLTSLKYTSVTSPIGSGTPILSTSGGSNVIKTGAAGGGAAHNNIQPSIVLTPLIKY